MEDNAAILPCYFSIKLGGVFASGGYARVESVANILSLAINWRGSEGQGWSGWAEGGEAVSEGHFSWKSGRLEKRSKAARYDELVVLPGQALDERTVRLSFVASKRVKFAVMSSKEFIPTKLGEHVRYLVHWSSTRASHRDLAAVLTQHKHESHHSHEKRVSEGSGHTDALN